MKKIIALAMVFVLMLGCVPAMADGEPEYKNVKIEVDGERIILLDTEEEQQKSIIVDGTVYVPIECFITAIGGEIIYNESENQITITLAPTSVSKADNDTDLNNGTYSDADIAAILTTGRWSHTTERGTAFFDFSADNTGKISGMLNCTWTVSEGVVSIDYTSQGKAWHREFIFTVSGSTVQLVEGDEAFTLNGTTDSMVSLIGTWHVLGDDSTELVLNADATCQIKVSGLTYSGTWAMNASQIFLTQNGSTIIGNYNGTSIGLNIGGNNFTFTR